MRFLIHLVIAVATAVAITGGLSAKRMVFRFYGHSKTGQNVEEKTTKGKIRIPSTVNRENDFSSFAYKIPMRKKVHSFHLKIVPGNYTKKTVNRTGHTNTLKFERVGQPLLFQAATKLKDIKGIRHAFKLRNDSLIGTTDTRHTNNVKFEMVGQPVSFQDGPQNNSLIEANGAKQTFDLKEKDLSAMKIVKTGKPLILYPTSSDSSSLKHLKKNSAKENEVEDDHDDEFAEKIYGVNTSHNNTIDNFHLANLQPPKPGHGQISPTTTVARVNSLLFGKQRHQNAPNNRLHSFLESIHNTNTASSLQDFKSFPQDENRVQTANLKVDQNIMGNLGAESSRVVGVNGVGKIKNGSRFSHMGMSPTELMTQEMTPFKSPLKVSEQNVASDNTMYWGEQALRKGHNKWTSYTNYQVSNINNNHENKEENTEQYNDYPNADQVYNFQRPENSNVEEDQGGYIAGYQYDDKYLPSQPPVQGYMPVDEFGSPFYGNETDEYFQREALVAHNKYRSLHQVPPLELDPQLSFEAEQLATLLASPDSARKVGMDNEGENIARGCSEWGGLTATGAVHRWYSEVCHYDWNKREIQPKAKDFMQLVWRGTHKVGIGRALTSLHGLPCAFIVALYRPGKINALDIESNISAGLFSPSYCNADGDENLLSTGYPSSFAARISQPDQPTIYQGDDKSPRSTKGFQVATEDTYGITFVPLTSFEREVDDEDTEGVLKEQPDIKAPYRFLPHVSYVQTPDDYVAMEADDTGVKRDYEPPKKVKPY